MTPMDLAFVTMFAMSAMFGVLLPLGAFIGLVLGYKLGRWHADQEEPR